ncbi:MAG: hypothetical protein K2O18_08565, partial [Oscillospiraceae bacterium]|nr:hypothetical protein [Oscillospiraceae bacterium]
AVTAALSSAKTTVNVGVTSSGVPGHAGGTTNAEDIFIAGEEGPELIVGAAHSTVFPTSETDRLINAVSSTYDNAGGGPESSVGLADTAALSADDADRFINAVTSNYDNRTTNYTLAASEAVTEGDNAGEQAKRITLEISGGSPIEVGSNSGASKEDIVEVLVANLRPALLNLVKEEIFEEGDGSYEY